MEPKAGIITSAGERVCPRWYGHRAQHCAGPGQPEGFIYTKFTSPKALMSLKVKSSHNIIDLLLILEQCDNNDDDMAALVHFSFQ